MVATQPRWWHGRPQSAMIVIILVRTQNHPPPKLVGASRGARLLRQLPLVPSDLRQLITVFTNRSRPKHLLYKFNCYFRPCCDDVQATNRNEDVNLDALGWLTPRASSWPPSRAQRSEPHCIVLNVDGRRAEIQPNTRLHRVLEIDVP